MLRSSFQPGSGKEWQQDYAMADLDDPRYAFVPRSLPPECKAFFCAHVPPEKATHLLLWTTNHPYLQQAGNPKPNPNPNLHPNHHPNPNHHRWSQCWEGRS